MSTRFQSFQGAVGKEVGRRGWFRSVGRSPSPSRSRSSQSRGPCSAGWRSTAATDVPRFTDVVLIAVAGCLLGAALLAALLFARRVWRRRRKAGQLEAERWDAFRRYLTDFRACEAPPATSSSGSGTSCTEIAFGIAERCSSRARNCTCPGRSTGERRVLDLADRRPRLGRRASRSTTSPPASGTPSRPGSGGSGRGGFSGGAEEAVAAAAEASELDASGRPSCATRCAPSRWSRTRSTMSGLSSSARRHPARAPARCPVGEDDDGEQRRRKGGS